MNANQEILKCLPCAVLEKIKEIKKISEIRIYASKNLCLKIDNKLIVTDVVVSSEELDLCIKKLCKYSIYAYSDSIKQGYIPLENGYRVGVCGKAIIDKGNIINISQIKSINIRIPTDDYYVPQSFLEQIGETKGILVYSSVNTGKTTFLKAIISYFSSPEKNKTISVIDCKNELYSPQKHKNSPVDFFSEYPKYEAINIAIANMSPDLIVCDEIGINDDTSTLIEAKNCGIDLICSAHASSINELLSRKNISILHQLNVFGGYVGISIKNGKRMFEFTERKDIKV